jgi:putative ABC transport system permease protein
VSPTAALAAYQGIGCLDRKKPPVGPSSESVAAQTIRTQFLAESILLAVIGGIVGVLAGATATAVYASTKNWAVIIPAKAWTGGIASALLIGAIAGLLPAIRASRMPPTVALRTV